MTHEAKDMLVSIFEKQTDLNDYVFAKHGMGEPGKTLTMHDIFSAVQQGKLKVNELPNQWLVKYCHAMKEEIAELEQELRWKWWSNDEINLQNIRVELIDILHFLISAMICSGLTAEKVFDIYKQKQQINLKRQNSDYNMGSKSEDDNRSIV